MVPWVNIGESSLHPSSQAVLKMGIEQVLALPPLKRTKKEDLRVVFVPTVSTGASSMKRDLPKIVIWSLLAGKPGKEFHGGVGEKPRPTDTYFTLLECVVNEVSKPFHKSLLTLNYTDSSYPVTLSKSMTVKKPKKDKCLLVSLRGFICEAEITIRAHVLPADRHFLRLD